MPDSPFVLVTGATGKQGGATARALLSAGAAVHAFVRDPDAPRARALAAEGATLVTGDLDDPASLVAALDGARGVFSVQLPDMADLTGDLEVRHARTIATAARKAGVEQIVHTSVSGTGTRGTIDAERWGAAFAHYWRSKEAAEQEMRDAETRYLTILRPSTFMENFVQPSFYYAQNDPDQLLVVTDPDVPQPFIAVADIGAAAAAAFAEPKRFHGVVLEYAGELLTFRQAAATLSEVLGRPITLPAGIPEARAAGLHEAFIASQEYVGLHPAPADPDTARTLGLPTTPFATWARTTL
ncbi:NmrA family NAD(P)-binding protein [Streptomyces xiamenensis]|uniref:NmrA family NAD(P)-binding protein n=1 Tax=Streptomyces xiamenensis TaxID=408015 RepID=UPI0037CD4B07